MPRSSPQHATGRPTVSVCGVHRSSYRRLLELQARRAGDVELRILDDVGGTDDQRPGAVARHADGQISHEPVAGMSSILRLVREAAAVQAPEGRIPRVI